MGAKREKPSYLKKDKCTLFLERGLGEQGDSEGENTMRKGDLGNEFNIWRGSGGLGGGRTSFYLDLKWMERWWETTGGGPLG